MADVMRFDPPKPANFAAALGGGIGLSQDLQAKALQNQIAQQAFETQVAKRNALTQFGKTGDVNTLMSVDPGAGVNVMEAQARKQKAQMDAIKPGLDYLYTIIDPLMSNPAKYPEVRANMIKNFPLMEPLLPAEWDQTKAAQFKSSYDRMKGVEAKLAGVNKPVALRPGGALIDPLNREVIYEQPAAPKDYKPEAFTNEAGETTWVTPGQGVPPGYTKEEKGKGVKWFHNPETDEYKPFSYRVQPPKGWKPVYKETDQDIPKWAIDKAISSLKNNMSFNDQQDATVRNDMINTAARNFIEQRNELKGGKGTETKPNYPNQIPVTGGVAKKLSQYSPDGHPIYQWPDGTKRPYILEKK